jgi:chaperonin GroEL
MIKKVLFGAEARKEILEGVRQVVKAVSVTMGAAGKTVLVGNAYYGNDGLVALPTIITKDGYSVSKHFELSDDVQNRGALLVKEAAAKTVDEAGDATTATCVLAGELIERGMELIDKSANSQELKKGIDAAVENVVSELKEMSIKVASNNKRIFQVASVSANNDGSVGNIIAEAYSKLGDEGVLTIEDSKGLETVLKLTDGFKWDKGWVSSLFITNFPKQSCEFDDPLILLYDKRITHPTQIERAVGISLQTRKPLVIVCEDAEGVGLAYLGINNKSAAIRVCVVKSSGLGDARRDFMEDLALLTGATYVSDLHGLDIKKVEEKHMGSAKKVVITQNDTIIIDGKGDKDKIEKFISGLRENVKEAKTEDEKYPIEKRIASLNGRIGVIHVGAATESELGEKLDRFDDAVRSTKSAIQEGVIAGGGAALLWIGQKLVIKSPQNDFEMGKQLVFDAIKKPLTQIIENAGLDYNPIVEKLTQKTHKSNDAEWETGYTSNYGYNLKNNKIEDLVEAGIIDSTKAIRCALVNAASVAGSALTSECLIVSTS